MPPRRKSRADKFPLSSIVVPALVFSGVLILSALLWRAFIRSPYFSLKKVNIEGLADDKYLVIRHGLLGKNIFTLNLKGLKREIEGLFPGVYCLALKRRFPSELSVTLKSRKAIAQIKKGPRFYLVDQSGMIMASVLDSAYESLPVITGLEDKIKNPKPGYGCDIKELNNVLELIRLKEENPALASYRLVRMDFSNGRASLYLGLNGPSDKPALLEVKYNPEAVDETVKVMALLLSKPGFSMDKVEYIDLKNPSAPAVLEIKESKKGK